MRDVITGLTLLGLTAMATADVINVPADHPTIQAAVDVAVTGDEIMVAPGTYNERIDFPFGKDLWIIGTGLIPADVTIDGTGVGSGPVMNIDGFQTSDTLIQNLVITGGDQGGMCIANSSPIIGLVGIIGNDGDFGAGALVQNSVGAEFIECGFIGNTAFSGAGMYIQQNSDITVERCTFLTNTASNGAGGLFAITSDVKIDRCLFSQNEANLGAGLVASTDTTITATNCLLRGNQLNPGGNDDGAAGLVLATSATLRAINCTIVDNTGGAAIDGSGAVEISNSIVRFNEPLDQQITVTGTLTISHSNVPGGYSGPGVIHDDPCFVFPGLNQRLDAGSPCIDSGDNALVPAGAGLDFVDNARFVDDANVNGTAIVVDMGCYERPSSILYVDANANGLGTGLSWQDAMTDLQDALDEHAQFPDPIEEIWVAAGVYKPDRGTNDRTMSFQMAEGLAIYGGFTGSELKRNDRASRDNITALTGAIGNQNDVTDNSYHVVFADHVFNTAILDGFQIRRGYAGGPNTQDQRGGAVYIDGGGPLFVDVVMRINDSVNNGGAVFSIDAYPEFRDCRFQDNEAQASGGAITVLGGTARLRQCRIRDNNAVAGSAGGVLVADSGLEDGEVRITLCTIASSDTNGVLLIGDSEALITNSIIWDNNLTVAAGSTASASYSNIQNWGVLGQPGIGVIETDPLFADPAGDDYRLLAGSPCIDAGSNNLVGYVVDLDLDLEPRFVDDPNTVDTGDGDGPIIDMGCFEFDVVCPGDVNGDGMVSIDDLLAVVADWGPCPGCATDFDGNGVVEIDDLLVVLAGWGNCP